jgi:peptide/nickel transport system substrate-binding protein
VTALTAGLSSCADAGVPAATARETLVIDTAFNAKSIDPARLFQPTDYIVTHALYETLLTYAGDDLREPVAGLAESWHNSPDGRTWTFTLRADARFSDGSPVRASDVVWSFERLRNVDASPAFLMEGITTAAPDERTVVLTTTEPRPDIPAIVTTPQLGVLNADQVSAHGGTAGADAVTADTAERYLNTESAGSGAYVLDSYSNTSQIVLRANPGHAGPAPAYRKVVIRNVPSSQAQLMGVQSGDSQIALDVSALQAKGLGDDLTVTGSRAGEVLYLGASHAPDSPTANPAIAEAVRLAIDYDGLRRVAGPGTEQATGVLPTSFVGSLPAGQGHAYDPDRARELVRNSGLGEVRLTLDYASDYHRLAGLDYGTIAQRVQRDLADVGIHVTLNPSPTATSLQRYVDGTTQLALWSYPPDYVDPRNLLAFAPGDFLSKRVHWPADADPELAALTEAASRAVAPDERVATFQAWSRAMNERSPFVPLLEPSFTTVSASSVTGVVRNPIYSLDLASIGRSGRS